MLTTGEYAERVGFSRARIHSLIYEGRILGAKQMDNGRWLIPEDASILSPTKRGNPIGYIKARAPARRRRDQYEIRYAWRSIHGPGRIPEYDPFEEDLYKLPLRYWRSVPDAWREALVLALRSAQEDLGQPE